MRGGPGEVSPQTLYLTGLERSKATVPVLSQVEGMRSKRGHVSQRVFLKKEPRAANA